MHQTSVLVTEAPTNCHSSFEHLTRCAVGSSGTDLLGRKSVTVECRTRVVDTPEEVELRWIKKCNWGFPNTWVLDFLFSCYYCRRHVFCFYVTFWHVHQTLWCMGLRLQSLHAPLQQCCRAYKHIKLPREKYPQHLGEVKCSRGEVKHSFCPLLL